MAQPPAVSLCGLHQANAISIRSLGNALAKASQLRGLPSRSTSNVQDHIKKMESILDRWPHLFYSCRQTDTDMALMGLSENVAFKVGTLSNNGTHFREFMASIKNAVSPGGQFLSPLLPHIVLMAEGGAEKHIPAGGQKTVLPERFLFLGIDTKRGRYAPLHVMLYYMTEGSVVNNLAFLIRDYCDYKSGSGSVLDLVIEPEFVLVKAIHRWRPLTRELVNAMPIHPADGSGRFQKARIVRDFIRNRLIPLHMADSYHGCICNETITLDLRGKVRYGTPFNGCSKKTIVDEFCRLYHLDSRVSLFNILSVASRSSFSYPLTEERHNNWLERHPDAIPYTSFLQRVDVYSALQILFYVSYGEEFPFTDNKGDDARLVSYFSKYSVPNYHMDLVRKALSLELSAQDLEGSFALKNLREIDMFSRMTYESCKTIQDKHVDINRLRFFEQLGSYRNRASHRALSSTDMGANFCLERRLLDEISENPNFLSEVYDLAKEYLRGNFI